MSEIDSAIAGTRAFAKQMTDAADVLEKAQEAETRADAAERRAAAAREAFASTTDAHKAALATQDAALAQRKKDYDAQTAEAEAALARHKQEHERIAQHSKEQVDRASATLSDLNGQVGEQRKQRDALAAEIAGLKARAESAAKL